MVCLAVKINSLRCFKTSGTASPKIERRITKDLNLQQQPCLEPQISQFCKPCPTHDKFSLNISMPFMRYVLIFCIVLHYFMLEKVTQRYVFYRLSTVKAIEAFQQY